MYLPLIEKENTDLLQKLDYHTNLCFGFSVLYILMCFSGLCIFVSSLSAFPVFFTACMVPICFDAMNAVEINTNQKTRMDVR